MIRILLVGDNEKIKTLCMSLEGENFHIVCTDSLPPYENEDKFSFSLILFDFRLFEQGHIQKAHEVFKRCGDSPVLVFVTEKTVAFAAKILKLGAADVIVFPCCRSYLEAYIRYYASKPEKFSVPDMAGAHVLKTFVGVSKASVVLKKQILLASQNDMPVLLLGETGTGKSLAARLIHDLSRRKKSPFVEENIAAVQETLVEGELFGTKAGAYTGAVTRPGLFECASGGTLFLDEIGGINANVQVKLLKVLESGEFRRVGDNETKSADVRIICATNSPLNSWKDSGRFRKDLYYRITGMEILMPTLTERTEDILPIARSFLERLCADAGKIKRFSPAAEEKIFNHRWPGNIRELHNCVSRAFYASAHTMILEGDIKFVL